RRRTRGIRDDRGRRVRQRAAGARRARARGGARIAQAAGRAEERRARGAVVAPRHVERLGADSVRELYSPVKEKETGTMTIGVGRGPAPRKQCPYRSSTHPSGRSATATS